MEEKESLFVKIFRVVFNLASVFVRGTLFYFCKLLYFLFKLDEFETEEEEDDDEIYEVIDDLNHT
ncbi:MAG: hypothetical protein ACI4PU_08205, partial [Intestinibacter sp.]